MNQLKVFEFAKEIGVETLVLMDKIRQWKLPVRSHMATLDEQMMAEIKTRLQAAEDAAKTKKRVVRKKPAAKSGASAAAAPTATSGGTGGGASASSASASSAGGAAKVASTKKAAAAGKSAIIKAANLKIASGAAPADTAAGASSPAGSEKSRSIIRRKAGEAEAKALEAVAEANIAAAVASATSAAVSAPGEEKEFPQAQGPDAAWSKEAETNPIASATLDKEKQELTASGIGTKVVAAAAAAAAAVGGGSAEPKRRNIVGRMDLRRITNVQPQRPGPSGPGSPSAPGAGPLGPRHSRTAPRNIRTGFYSAEPVVIPEAFPEHAGARDLNKDEKKKRPGAGGGTREEEVKIFTATEFRKREVIFQPKKKKVVAGREAKKTQLTTPAAHKRVIRVDSTITLQNLASEIGLKAPVLLKKLMAEGVQAAMNTELDFDTVALIVPEFGWEAQNTHRSVDELVADTAHGDLEAERITRPPVVTVMGHVDHGKTSLLDAIRKARVAEGEAGGITQHIGAYSVTLEDGHKVTFIDTPGHEAFTAMRARGANATDIAVIVVAADDGVMPQTAEAINHAKAAKVPIIVAVNKMDKPGANPDRIKQQMTEFELVPEEWGGTTIYCPVSALKGTGIKELLEQIILLAEIQELKANPKRSGTGVVIESRMEKGRGSVATLLVQDGTVAVGQVVVVGSVVGRIRGMMDDRGQSLKEVGPGQPIEILGLPDTPMAGDRFDVAKDEESARQIAGQRLKGVAKEETPSAKMTLDQLFAKVKAGEAKELALVLKVDVAGSLEAVKGMLEKLGTQEVKLKLVHSAVGGVTENDVLLASTAKGVVVGFNVRPDLGASRVAKEKSVEIKSYSIIYELVDDLKKALQGLLAPQIVEKSLGRAEVRNTFSVPKVGVIAGCFITDGKVARNGMLRLVRDGKIITEGKVASLKRFKDDVREVASGFECGIGIENFNDIKVGDVIESFVKEEQAREL